MAIVPMPGPARYTGRVWATVSARSAGTGPTRFLGWLDFDPITAHYHPSIRGPSGPSPSTRRRHQPFPSVCVVPLPLRRQPRSLSLWLSAARHTPSPQRLSGALQPSAAVPRSRPASSAADCCNAPPQSPPLRGRAVPLPLSRREGLLRRHRCHRTRAGGSAGFASPSCRSGPWRATVLLSTARHRAWPSARRYCPAQHNGLSCPAGSCLAVPVARRGRHE
jgi:hypothetical protein